MQTSDDVRHIPGQPIEDHTARGLLALVPELTRDLLAATSAKLGDPGRDWLVLDARWGLESQQRTLEEVAQGVLGGMTRERARQIEKKALQRMTRVVDAGYSGNGYQVRMSVSSLLEDVFGAGPSLTTTMLSEDDLFERLALERPTPQEVRRLEFLFALRDVRRYEGRPPRRPALWGIGSKPDAEAVIALVDALDGLLCEAIAQPLSDLDVVMELVKRGRRSTVADVRRAAQLCPTVERLEDGRLQGRFEWLVGRGNQAHRLLELAQAPLDAADMAREINARSRTGRPTSRTNLANQMAADERFIPIGKSGSWGLKGLHDADAGTIVEMMIEFLQRRGTPAAAEEIHQAVAGRRPVGTASVSIYLTTSETFVQLPDGRWALKDWKEARKAPARVTRTRVRRKPLLDDLVKQESIAALSAQPDRSMRLGELITLLMASLGRPRASLYQYINRCEVLEKVRVGTSVVVRLKGQPGVVLAEADSDYVLGLISAGESARLEFKSSLRWDMRHKAENRPLERNVLKTIAAFLNSEGGELLIGVEDDRTVCGIEPDMALLGRQPQDGPDRFLQVLATLIKEKFGAATAALVKPRVLTVRDKAVCLVSVAPAAKPAILKDADKEELYVRMGSTTQPLGFEQGVEYVRLRWPNR